jgi:hypothetical protein
VRELVVILSDVYGLAEVPAAVVPTLAQIRRFGATQRLNEGWRPWIAARLGRPDLAGLAPATLAAALARPEGDGWTLLATPLSLAARIDHVRMDPGAVLALDAADAARVATDFATTFAGSGLSLRPLDRGGFLLLGFPEEPPRTEDPACAIGNDIAPFLPQGPQARRLRALSGELEMWLHGHPLNRSRIEGGRRPLSGLWLWGGGRGVAPSRSCALPRGFGDDPCLQGLWQACGATLAPAAEATPLFAAPHPAPTTVVEFQVFREGAAFAGLGDFDRRWLGPAFLALRDGRLTTMIVATGDRLYRLERRDLWKFWRRAPLTLAVAA